MSAPLQIGMPFVQGQAFKPVFAGIPTQVKVTQRWPDGSVKHAILCAMTNGGKLDIVEGTPVVESPAFPVLRFAVEMNGESFDPDADQAVTHWHGPICSAWTFGNGKHAGQGNVFMYVEYWHQLDAAHVMVIVENTNTEAVTEFKPHVVIFNEGETLYESPADLSHVMPINSCWPFEFWTKEVPQVNVAFDTAYLISTKALPPFDMAVQLDPAAIDKLYKRWLDSNKNILDRWAHEWGLFDRHQGNAGARADIGPFPSWSTQLLYSWDARCWEMERGNAKLAMQYACSIREGNSANAHYGEPVSILDRPTCQLLHLTTLNVLPDADPWELQPDPAHQPNPFYLTYLLRGEQWALAMLKFWSAYNAGYSNGAGIDKPYGRGPTGAEGGIPGSNGAAFQVRGQAWMSRARAELAWIIPDDDSMKPYFVKLMDDMLVIWEGKLGINPRPDPRWQWGNTIDKQNSPLHFWDYGNGDFAQDASLDGTKCRSAFATWELTGMFCYALNRMGQLGYPVGPIRAHLKPCLLAMNKYLASYRMASKDETSVPFANWPDVLDCYAPGFDVDAWWQSQRGTEQGYVVMAGQGVQVTGDPAYWQWFYDDVYKTIPFKENPKWALRW